MMAKEMSTPGKHQIKALFVSAGNPVLSVPTDRSWKRPSRSWNSPVGLDFYVTETTAHCDYILPVTTMYERDDFALTFQQFQATPFRQTTEAVVDVPGEARTEWDIVDELTSRMGSRTPVFAALAAMRKVLGTFGRRLSPRALVDGMIRLSDGGDRYGLRRGGLTFSRLSEQHPHGVVVAPHIRTGVLGEVVVYRHGRVRLRHDDIAAEISAMRKRGQPGGLPDENDRDAGAAFGELVDAQLAAADAWRARPPRADARRRRWAAPSPTVTPWRCSSPHGRIALPVALTRDIVPGTIAIPHGWGHKGTGGWQLANRAGGANVNQLMSSDPRDVEALAGMSWLTGVPVEVELVESAPLAQKVE